MFIKSFQSEWLKKKRSLASWLVVAGASFVPSIIFAARVKNHAALGAFYASDDFWLKTWNQSWEAMAVALLPMGVVLATGLIAQIEYKNNAWKQLHATPQGFTTIYFAKFLVVAVMLGQVFVLFLAAVYLSAVLPALLFANVSYPAAPIPYGLFFEQTARYFVDCLPVLGLQYLLSVHFRNFLVPVGVGFGLWFLGIGMLSWDYSWLFPYNHGTIDFLLNAGQFKKAPPPVDVGLLAVFYFAVFTAAGYFLYLYKSDKA
ncbi:MAG: ABC transporter permease [Acidobacteria bacterium]|nr:ABC transporter permease [Acidobacteriota bacterium]